MIKNIEEAMEYIKGYCNKHAKCVDCRLVLDDGNCFFEQKLLPCDWDIDHKPVIMSLLTKVIENLADGEIE